METYTDFLRLRSVYPGSHRDVHHPHDDDGGDDDIPDHHQTYHDWSNYIRTHRDRIR